MTNDMHRTNDETGHLALLCDPGWGGDLAAAPGGAASIAGIASISEHRQAASKNSKQQGILRPLLNAVFARNWNEVDHLLRPVSTTLSPLRRELA